MEMTKLQSDLLYALAAQKLDRDAIIAKLGITRQVYTRTYNALLKGGMLNEDGTPTDAAYETSMDMMPEKIKDEGKDNPNHPEIPDTGDPIAPLTSTIADVPVEVIEPKPAAQTAKASATLCCHVDAVHGPSGHAALMTMAQLAELETPEATKTYRPISHLEVVQTLESVVKDRGWGFMDEGDKRFQVAVTPEGKKMFGVSRLLIPGTLTDKEFGLAVGFRNSYNKTMAFRMCVGTTVFVCDNMAMHGDMQVRREHSGKFELIDLISASLDDVPQLADRAVRELGQLREVKLLPEAGVNLLAEAVEKDALPLERFMNARRDYLLACDGAGEEVRIDHPRTLWGVYQAVTAQWKVGSPFRVQDRTEALEGVMKGYMGLN